MRKGFFFCRPAIFHSRAQMIDTCFTRPADNKDTRLKPKQVIKVALYIHLLSSSYFGDLAVSRC